SGSWARSLSQLAHRGFDGGSQELLTHDRYNRSRPGERILVKLLRTLSTARLITLIVIVAALGASGAAIAVAAGDGGATPPPKPLAQAIHDALAGTAPAGLTARISFTNNLFPSGTLTGVASSALLSGATGRLWVTADGRGRLELTSDAGDTQIVWSK